MALDSSGRQVQARADLFVWQADGQQPEDLQFACCHPHRPRPGVDRQDQYWRMDRMSHTRRFDHVGITVADLDTVTAFFVGLGLEVEGTTFVEGEFLDTVIGIPDSRTEIVMLRPPDGGTRLELSSFVRPDHEPGSPAAMANELGLRNVAFEVDDLQAAVDRLAADGYGLVGGIGQYEHSWRMAYVRGPEGIIVSLAERIG
jgi:catechol 2,3-dioxygenase-like lactoylglutathione lyase family enzyme